MDLPYAVPSAAGDHHAVRAAGAGVPQPRQPQERPYGCLPPPLGADAASRLRSEAPPRQREQSPRAAAHTQASQASKRWLLRGLIAADVYAEKCRPHVSRARCCFRHSQYLLLHGQGAQSYHVPGVFCVGDGVTPHLRCTIHGAHIWLGQPVWQHAHPRNA